MDDDAPGPVSSSRLADLQAGLLDDDAAARLRHLARTDPRAAGQLAALDRVRRDVAALGVDAASAPDVPAEVTDRVAAALRALPPPVDGGAVGWRRGAAAAGIVAAVVAVGVGAAVLVRDGPAGVIPTSSNAAARTPGGVPLADDQIRALLDKPLDLGPLAAPQRLASCLGGLGYPTSTSLLGARPLVVSGRPGVLLLLPGDVPHEITAVVVAPNCSSVDTGLDASTVVTRP